MNEGRHRGVLLVLIFVICVNFVQSQIDFDVYNDDVDDDVIDTPRRTRWVKKESKEHFVDDDIIKEDNKNRNGQYTIDHNNDDYNEELNVSHKEELELESEESKELKTKTQLELMMEEEEKAFQELGVLELMIRQIKRDFGAVTTIISFITPPQVKDIIFKLWNDNKKSILGVFYGAAIPFSKVLAKFSKITGLGLLNFSDRIEEIHEELELKISL